MRNPPRKLPSSVRECGEAEVGVLIATATVKL